jgi:hypothetical protein
MAPLVPEPVSLVMQVTHGNLNTEGVSAPDANPSVDNETADWYAPSTVLETWGGLRVVAVRVSGAAGLRIKRQNTQRGWLRAPTRGGTSLETHQRSPSHSSSTFRRPELLLQHFLGHTQALRAHTDRWWRLCMRLRCRRCREWDVGDLCQHIVLPLMPTSSRASVGRIGTALFRKTSLDIKD